MTTNTKISVPFEAVIFDMDGTLIASTEADYLAWRKIFEDYGKTLTAADYVPLLGIKSNEVMKHYLHVEDEDELRDGLARKLVYFNDIITENGIHPIPFADEFLKSLLAYDVRLALATSSRKAKMEMVMNKLGLLSYFEVIVAGEEVKHGKPAPEVFLITAEKLQLQPSTCIVFEDAVNGVKAAKKAGMKCVAIASTHDAGLLHEADKVITTFEGLNFEALCSTLQ